MKPAIRLESIRESLLAHIIVGFVALGGTALIIYGQRQWFDDLMSVRPGLIPVAVGMGLILIAAWFTPVAIHTWEFVESVQVSEWGPGTRWLVVATGGFALCVAIGVQATRREWTAWSLLALWGLGISGMLVGLVPARGWQLWWRELRQSFWHETGTWVVLTAIFTIGLIVRVANLEHFPPIMAGDEAQFAYEAVSVRDRLDWVYNPFHMGVWHHPRIVHTLMAVSITALGQTVAAARLPWAILGALNVPAVYLLGREAFGKCVGLVAAILLAALPLHIQFSRTAMDMTGDTLFLTLALACMMWAMRDGNVVAAALAGLFVGLAQYFYFAGRIAILLLIGYALLCVLRKPRLYLHRWFVMAVVAVVALGVMFPNLYGIYDDDTRSMSPRLKFVSIWATGDIQTAYERNQLDSYIVDQVQRAMLAYVHFQDESDVYGRYNPVLGWYDGVPFLIGLVVLFRNWRDPRSLALLAWVGGTALLGGALLIDPPHYPRYVNATPAAACVASVGIVWLADVLGQTIWKISPAFPHGRRNRLAGAAALGAGLALALANLWSYSTDYTDKAYGLLYGESTRELNDVVTVLDALGGKYHVWRFSSLDLDMDATDLIRYLSPQNAGQEFEGDIVRWREFLEPGPTAFVIAPSRLTEVAAQLTFQFPGGELRQYTNERTGNPLVYLYVVEVPNWSGAFRDDQDG